MLPIPSHLVEVFQVDLDKSEKGYLEGSLKCHCGCRQFKIKTFSSVDKDGSLRVEAYKDDYALVIEATCKSCEQSWLIFDMSKHGYNGFVCNDGVPVSEADLRKYKCIKCHNDSFEMIVGIQVEDKEQFIEEVVDEYPGEYTDEDYVEAFNWIVIHITCTCCDQKIDDWVSFETS